MNPALLAAISIGGAGTPLDYDTNLTEFFDAENGVTTSSGEVTDWTGQGSAIDLTVPSGAIGPDFVADDQNGLPGLSFEDPISGPGGERLIRKLSSANSVFDQFFFGAGFKGIAFAGRWDRASDGFGFDTRSTIASKGIEHGEGWALQISSNGTLSFRHQMTNGSEFKIEAPGFYSVGDLVLGSVRYSGGNSSSSAFLRLYNQSTFVDTGVITTASGSTKENDSDRDLVIGNLIRDGNEDINAPFEGSLFGVWFTKAFSNSLDDSYFARWIP